MSLLDVTRDCIDTAQTLGSVAPQGAPRVRMFARDAVDRVLTRTHPIIPFILYAPFIVAFLWGAPWAPREYAVELAAGWLAWTLVEYVLHRFGLHLPTHTPAWRVAFFLVHGHHHRDPRDPMRLVATPWQSGLLLALVAGLAASLAPARWPPFVAGTLCGYLFYEYAHWRAHHGTPRTPWMRWLRRYHLRHHHRDDTRGFGISNPLWDVVFGTLGKRG